MAKHEFGIMDTPPKSGERFDCYEPEKYHTISVDDDYIEPLLNDFERVDCFFHGIDIKIEGLVYCGITIIPPQSLCRMIEITEKVPELSKLTGLLKKAQRENKFVIHYGL
ncbi:MAG: hypothetical protein Q4D20_08020 [Clostridia bacterium]|nr:hypothetical protein [Clostridia bacterium]